MRPGDLVRWTKSCEFYSSLRTQNGVRLRDEDGYLVFSEIKPNGISIVISKIEDDCTDIGGILVFNNHRYFLINLYEEQHLEVVK